mmetsp:Transcript_7151/g.11207  ORF Transcript_7151/g.11207 Transcript_7151/m.11207 type:complete len:214 (+) Transcript_7151:169-810(+)
MAMVNPYIDYNLLNSQNEFTPVNNIRFEMQHRVSLNLLPIQKAAAAELSCTDLELSKSNHPQQCDLDVQYIEFEWSPHIVSKFECDTQHMLYLIYLALLEVEKRQISKNAYYVRLKQSDRVLPLLNKERFLGDLIEWCVAENVDINGALLKTLPSKDFINHILTRFECSMGFATKIYSKLYNDIDCSHIKGTVCIPNSKYNRWCINVRHPTAS